MKLRIRYSKTNKPGIEKSVILISQTTGARYFVQIDKNEITYKIVNLSGRGNFYGGEGVKNLEVLQRHIRKKLKALGVEIKREVRTVS